jgi:hypothetical protein
VKFLFALFLLVFGHFLVSLSHLAPKTSQKPKQFIPKAELNPASSALPQVTFP